MMPMVIVEETEATFLGLLPEKIYLNPAEIRTKRKTRPAKKEITWRTFKKRHSSPWMVGTSGLVGLTQRPDQVGIGELYPAIMANANSGVKIQKRVV